MKKVAIVGVGYTPFRSLSREFSMHELQFEACKRAYADAGVNPREEIDGFLMCGEDTDEGQQVIDCELLDGMGGILTSSCYLGNDGMVALITAYIQILSGFANIMAVEARSKASNIITPKTVHLFSFDPILHQPLEEDPDFVAGMEMNRYLYETGTTSEQCALVSVKNKRNALDNPIAAYGDIISIDDVLNSETICYPLKKLDMRSTADGSICMVLASEDRAKLLTDKPIWIRGVGWCGDTSRLEQREWGSAVYTEVGAKMAYKMAGVTNPRKEIDVVEVDDTFSYKELQHIEALGLCRRGEAGLLLQEGVTARGGDLPINSSGGCLGEGHVQTATGLARALEVVLQLRGEAGKRQTKGAKTGLAHYWAGIPSTLGGVMILSNED